MDKEKQAFKAWFLKTHSDAEFNFSNDLYDEDFYPIRFTRGFYGGYHARDAEIAHLKAEIERKDEALEHIVDYWNGASESAVDAIEEAISTAEQALTKPEEVEG